MRVSTVLAALVALVATTASAQPTPPAGEAVFVMTGRGWGHGVGMAQYGAYGMALEGRTHREILAHFYAGTTVGRAGMKRVRVLLAEGRGAVALTSPGAFSVVDGTGAKYPLPKGPLTLRPNLTFKGPKGKVKAVSPLRVRPGKAGPLTLDGKPFRGAIELSVQNGFLRVINIILLDEYIQGVVANEMPFSWPSEALEAQAIAARTYALTSIQKGKPYHLYADVRDQVYRGVEGETVQTNSAVRATAGKVVLYGGKLARTFYFSSSGGKTANAVDVFGSPVPYLVSRPDPWDRHSPHHSWGPLLFGARTLQAKFGVTSRVVDLVGVATPSGRLKSLSFQMEDGLSRLPAALLRTTLGLRSTWVTIGVLRLDPAKGPAVANAPLVLTGVARGVESPGLAASVDGGQTWKKVATLSRDANGAFSVQVKPLRTTRYRLQAIGAASPAILVRVGGG